MIVKINGVDLDIIEVDESPRYKQRDATEWTDIAPVMHKQLYETFHGRKLAQGSMKDGYASFMSCGLNS